MLAYLLIGILSCVFGKYATKWIPVEIVKWIAMVLFFGFALQMFYMFYSSENNFEELEEVEKELADKKEENEAPLVSAEMVDMTAPQREQPQIDLEQ